MNKLFVSPEAKKDMEEIRKYITEELDNPIAAQNTLAKITKCIHTLEKFSGIGSPLSSIIDFETDYRFLVCGQYLAFYRTEKDAVYVDRIIYGKRDYTKILFGCLQEDSEY